MFGPSKAEVWAQLAGETGATFVEGGFFGKDKVVARVRDWTVTLDTVVVSAGKTTVIYTRMRAPYVNPDGFRFDVYRKSVFSGLGRLLGIQDVAVGVPDIDEEFVIKGGDESRLRALFADPKLCELIRAQPEFHLQVKDDEGWFGTHFPEGVDELHFQVLGVIKDIPRLRALFDLFAEVLDRLCLIGSAYEGDPGVTL
jgi:hypothetical protein